MNKINFNKKFLGMGYLIFLYIFCQSSLVFASVYKDYHYQHKLPDGNLVALILNGGRYYARAETPRGYTVIFDLKQQQYYYATLSEDKEKFISTGIPYTGDESNLDLQIPKHLKLSDEARKRIIAENQRLEQEKMLQPTDDDDDSTDDDDERDDSDDNDESNDDDQNKHKKINLNTTTRQIHNISANNLIGNLTGLTILIDFSDDVATINSADVENFLNQNGYSQNGNLGSVKDYWFNSSGGLLNYHNNLLGYYRASQPKSYYIGGNGHIRAQELIREALEYYANNGYDFSTLTLNHNNEIMALNIFYAGFANSAWGQGLWPYTSYLRVSLGNGIYSGPYQITDMKGYLEIGTFCHENGHMIGGYPDLYDSGNESAGIGKYGIMGHQHYTQPLPPNPYLRELSGWESVIELNPAVNSAAPSGALHDLSSDTQSYRYSNPNNPKEFFYIESAFRDAKGQSFPDEGLLIWHIDTAGNNGCELMTPICHYQVSVEQADGSYHLETWSDMGSPGDLFHQGYQTQFNDSTLPDARWWDGSASGLNIVDVGPVEANLCFAIGTGTCTGSNAYPVVNINGPYSGIINSPVQFNSTGSYDPDGTIASYEWDFGDGSNISNQANPTHVYMLPSSYTIRLTVTDNNGAQSVASSVVTIGGGTDQTIADACATQPPNYYVELFNNEAICMGDGSGDMLYFYFNVESNITQIRIRTDHGSGDANLYYSYSVWPSTSVYHQSSTNTGNTEMILFSYPPEGWNYIGVYGEHSGVSLQVDMQ